MSKTPSMAVAHETFEVKRAWYGWLTNRLLLQTPDGADAYCIDYKSSDADAILHRGGRTGPVIAKADLSRDGGIITLTSVDGTHSTLKGKSMFSRQYTVVNAASGAFANPTTVPLLQQHPKLWWKGTSSNGASKLSLSSLKLVDDNGTVYATFASSTHRSVRRGGRLSLMQPGLDQQSIEWIFLACGAIFHKEEKDWLDVDVF